MELQERVAVLETEVANLGGQFGKHEKDNDRLEDKVDEIRKGNQAIIGGIVVALILLVLNITIGR